MLGSEKKGLQGVDGKKAPKGVKAALMRSPSNGLFSKNSRKNEEIMNRLGLTEQMEKYISHDLGLIQEEQEIRKKTSNVGN